MKSNLMQGVKTIALVTIAVAAVSIAYHMAKIAEKDPETITNTTTIYREVKKPSETNEEKTAEPVMEMTELEEEEMWDSLELLARCVEAEAGNQGLAGKRLVADVILNRVADPDFPDTIEGVIKQKNQFSTWSSGAIDRAVPSEETYEACRMELLEISVKCIYYFRAGHYGKYGEPWGQVGDHYFCSK